MVSIDLNNDLGEHPNSNLDEQIMPFLSSCNIACGGHVGDEKSVRETVLLAKKFNVAIGAHPSFPDRKDFGRKVINISNDELEQSIREQINLVHRICQEHEIQLHHVKPHGALYNQAAKDEKLSDLICSVIKSIDPAIKLYGLAHSITSTTAEKHGVEFVAEGFADRKYESDKTLMSRTKEKAVITSEKEVLQQVEEMVLNNRVFAKDWISIQAQTICLHSDTQGAVNLAGKIRHHLEAKGVYITSV